MIIYVRSNIFTSPAKVLVNTVNTVGVMGKGLALEFKKLYPGMYKVYRRLCKTYKFKIGDLLLYKSPTKWILNFPTKRSWRNKSRLADIRLGLEKFVKTYKKYDITSIAFPELGVGNGGLDWETQVKPLMKKYLSRLPIYVYIHLYDENQYMPLRLLREYINAKPCLLNYLDVVKQLRRSLKKSHNKLITYPRKIYKGEMTRAFKINKRKYCYYLTRHDIEETWNILKINRALLPFNYPSIIASHNDYLLFNELWLNLRCVNEHAVKVNKVPNKMLFLENI